MVVVDCLVSLHDIICLHTACHRIIDGGRASIEQGSGFTEPNQSFLRSADKNGDYGVPLSTAPAHPLRYILLILLSSVIITVKVHSFSKLQITVL
jgi:hypothetical protein